MRLKEDKLPSEKILSLIMETGCISRLSVSLMRIYHNKQAMWVNRLAEENLIMTKRVDGCKIYEMTADGIRYLKAINECRHRDESVAVKLNNGIAHRRAKISEVVALLKLADYPTHQDDKPTLKSAIYQKRTAEKLPFITRKHTYNFFGCNDRKEYLQNAMAINCFYYSTELKDYLSGEMKEQFNVYTEQQAISFSRMIGVLITANKSYCLYNTGKVAIEIRTAGETAMQIELATVISALTDYKINQLEDVIIFGESFKAAYKLLSVSKTKAFKNRKKDKEHTEQYPPACLQINSIGKTVYYLPLVPASAEILRLLQYSNWKEVICQLSLGDGYTAIDGKYSVFDGELEDFPVYVEILPNLRRMENLAAYLLASDTDKLLIACPTSHAEFYHEVLQNEEINTEISFYYFTSEAIETFREELEKMAGDTSG